MEKLLSLKIQRIGNPVTSGRPSKITVTWYVYMLSPLSTG